MGKNTITLPRHSKRYQYSRGLSQAAADDESALGKMSYDGEKTAQETSFEQSSEITYDKNYGITSPIDRKGLYDYDEARGNDDDEIEVSAVNASTNAVRHIWNVTQEKWINIGHWLEETTEAQVAMLGIIYFDLVISCLLTAITSTSVVGDAVQDGWFSSLFWILSDFVRSTIILRLLHGILSLTLAVSVLELLALMTTFGVEEFFSHAGYALDAVVVAIISYHEILIALLMDDDYIIEEMTHVMGGGTTSVHLLSVLRLWRIARLTTTLVKVATKEQTNRIHELESLEEDTQTLKSTLTKLLEHSKQEHEEKVKLQSDIQHLEDEIETLSEALRIAARDVASGNAILKQKSSDLYKSKDDEYDDDNDDEYDDDDDDEVPHQITQHLAQVGTSPSKEN